MTRDESPAYRAIQRYLIAGVVIVVLVFAGIGGWAATTEASQAQSSRKVGLSSIPM